jgi:hypothetical protein
MQVIHFTQGAMDTLLENCGDTLACQPKWLRVKLSGTRSI